MIAEALNAFAAASNKTFTTDRSQTVGASEIGQCLRKTFWTKNEGDPTYGAARDPEYKDGWGATMRGTVYENAFWAPAMAAAYGNRFLYGGADQQTFVSGFLSATPDGLLTGLQANALAHLGVDDIGGDCIMTECKTADPRTNLSAPKPQNVFQTQVQMGLVREQTDYKPGYSLLTYTDASFWDNVREFPIKFDREIYAVAKLRAAKIMTATRADDLPAEGWMSGGKECEYCPFTKACGVQRKSIPVDTVKPDPQFVAEVADMAREIKAIEADVTASETALRIAQQQLRDRLREKSVNKVPGIVSWAAVKGRTAYDNKAIQQAAIAAGIDITKFQTTGEPSDRLTVSDPDEGGKSQAA